MAKFKRIIIAIAIILLLVVLPILIIRLSYQPPEIPYKPPPMIKGTYSPSSFLTISQGSTFQVNITQTSMLDTELILPFNSLEIMAYNNSASKSPPQQQTLNYTFSPNPVVISPQGTNSTLLTVTMANDSPVGKYLLYLRYGNSNITHVGGHSLIVDVNPINAQSTPSREITILYPTNGTFFNVSMGVDSFQLKYATNIKPLSWIGYSIDGGQNKTAYGAWYNIEQILYDAEGNPSIRVSGVFDIDGNHNLTLYANNTSGDWAIPQTVTYLVNINADTYIPPTTSNPTTIQSESLSPTSTLSPRNPPHLELVDYLLPITIIVTSVVVISLLLFRRHQKTANLRK